MNSPTQNDHAGSRDEPSIIGLRLLAILGLLSCLIYAVITWLSPRFELGKPETERPIIAVILLFAAAFLVYAFAIRIASRTRQTAQLMWLIVVVAIVSRVIVLFSVPIQEVDIYRYIWDGVVVSEGISPFRYPPDQVKAADPIHSLDPDLRTLARVRRQNPAIAEVLDRVHFGQLPTVYPPTSQAVFLWAAMMTPEQATVTVRVRIMKLCLIAFDLGILLLLVLLLNLCGMPPGLSVMYAWCPLVMKEVANSGHLDTIAVFLSLLVVYWLAKLVYPRQDSVAGVGSNPGWPTVRLTMIAIALAAAVGAKLYPVVLAPLVCLIVVRRLGWQFVIFPSLVFVIATAAILWPMLPHQTDVANQASVVTVDAPNDVVTSSPQPNDPSAGIKTFLKSWEMNDFIFMVIVENLKPAESFPDNRNVWFSVLPDDVRQPLVSFVSNRFSIPLEETPFLITRIVTSIVFLMVAVCLAWQASKQDSIKSFCRAAFLTLAWFWLLSPTQNPWYWLWALPLLPFVRNRAWIAVSGLVLVYYLRFWLGYHFADSTVLGTGYRGTDFFDFVVTWLEFGPWFIWLTFLRLTTSSRRRLGVGPAGAYRLGVKQVKGRFLRIHGAVRLGSDP